MEETARSSAIADS
jgi:hypothetical protein